MIFGETEKVINKYDHMYIKKQINKRVSFGHSINIVLITDRLYGCLKGYKEFFQRSTDIEVDVLPCVEDAEHLSCQKPIDFVIIVGMLADEHKYSFIQKIRQINKFACVILLESLTLEAESCASEFEMNLFDKQAPLSSLFHFMQGLFDAQTVKMKNEYPDWTTRDKVWLSNIHDIVSEKMEEAIKAIQATALERPPLVKLRVL